MMQVRRARPDEKDTVLAFYDRQIDLMQNLTYHPKWTKGVYPEESYLAGAVDDGEMYLTMEGDTILGAMILNNHTVEGYETAPWQIEAADDEIFVIHTLCTACEYMHRGIGTFMTREALRIIKALGGKTVRLDVLLGNLPAEKLYRRVGFTYIGRTEIFYEDTGRCEFDLYEYVLR